MAESESMASIPCGHGGIRSKRRPHVGLAVHGSLFRDLLWIDCLLGICRIILRQYLSDPKRVRLFNRLMALLLAGSAVYLLQA